MYRPIEEYLPIATRCARNFCYKRDYLDRDEIEAEAWFVLSMIMLTGYSIDDKVFETEEDFIKHFKSRIYRDLGTYIKPWIKSRIPFEEEYCARDFDVRPIGEVIEGLVETELEMQLFTCYMKGITDDAEVRNIVKVDIKRIASARVEMCSRVVKLKTRKSIGKIKNEARRISSERNRDDSGI